MFTLFSAQNVSQEETSNWALQSCWVQLQWPLQLLVTLGVNNLNKGIKIAVMESWWPYDDTILDSNGSTHESTIISYQSWVMRRQSPAKRLPKFVNVKFWTSMRRFAQTSDTSWNMFERHRSSCCRDCVPCVGFTMAHIKCLHFMVIRRSTCINPIIVKFLHHCWQTVTFATILLSFMLRPQES